MKTTFIDTKTKSGQTYKLRVNIWGTENPPNKTLVCIHGLSGNSMDFEFVGEYLSTKEQMRIVAIDMAGRGESDHYDDPKDYCFEQYLEDIDVILETIGCSAPASCDWLGVSMGGLLGFYLSARDKTPIRRMVLSDIGPEVPQADLDMIHAIFTTPASYQSLDEIVHVLKEIPPPYSRGWTTDDQRLHFAQANYRQRPDGTFARALDTKIMDKFKTHPLGPHKTLWHLWEQSTQPVLALRGEHSTLFPHDIVKRMMDTKIGAPMDLVEVPDCGHVPSLYPDEQIKIIADWLRRTPVPEA